MPCAPNSRRCTVLRPEGEEMARKKKEECKAAPAWLTSFGDLMSLLLTFFILLYSMSVVSLDKFNLSIRGITEAFGSRKMVQQNSVPKGREVPLDFKDMHPKIKNGHKIKQKLSAVLAQLGAAGVKGEVEGHGTVLRMRLFADNLFVSGRAEPTEAARPYIAEMAQKLKVSDLQIEIEGHSDSVPIHNGAFSDNWDLSAERAVSVLRLFLEAGYDGHLLAARGAGEYHPIDTNDTPQGRMRNRRIEFIIDLSE